MSEKIELFEEDLSEVSGGSLTWSGTTVTSTSGLTYTRVAKTSACAQFMAANCRGMSDEQTLQALLNAGYITV